MKKPQIFHLKGVILYLGILLEILWLSLTFISRGIPIALCQFLVKFFPPVLHPEIMKMQHGFYYDVPNKEMPALVFIGLFSIAFFLYFILVMKILKTPSKKNSLGLILLFSILFRLTLLPSVLIHENDIYRYLWDGKVTLEGVNPYKYPPRIDDSDLHQHPEEEVQKLEELKNQNKVFYSRISYRHIPTVYPPLSQAVFAFSNFIKRDSLLVLKFLFALFDFGVILVLLKLLHLFKMNPNQILIYAWSPLVLREFAISGHHDAAAVFFMALSLLLLFSFRKVTSVICLCFGVLAKFFPVVFLPLFLKKVGWRPIFLGVIFLILTYLPFVFWGGTGLLRIFKGFFVYSEDWAVNGGIFELFYSFFNMFSFSRKFSLEVFCKILIGFIYFVFLGFLFCRKPQDDKSYFHQFFLAISVLFLLSPVGNPWYFCWVIPFLCFFPYKSFIILSWLLVFSYLSFTRELGFFTLGDFKISHLVLFQYIPFYFLLVLEIFYVQRQKNIRSHSGI